MSTTGKIRHISTGNQLLKDLLRLNPIYGGRQVIITGKMGTGKSSLLVKFALNDLEKGAYIIWRGRTTDSFHYFPNWTELVKILHHENDDVHVYVTPFGSKKATEVTDQLEMDTYKRAGDILQKAEKDRINVVIEPTFYEISKDFVTYLYAKARIRLTETERKGSQFGTLLWFEFHQQLLERTDSEWWTVFYDEIDDVFPANPSGVLWHLIAWAQLNLKDFRKSLVSMFGTAHNYSDIDYRIYKKIPTKIYLAGAQVPKDSLLYKQAVQSVERGQAKIEWDNKYGEISNLKPLPIPKARLVVHRYWTAEIPNIGYSFADMQAELSKVIIEQGKAKAYELLEQWRREGKVDRNYYYYFKDIIKNHP